MTRMYHYATVSKALDQLNEKGFTFDFNLNSDLIKKNPEKFEIVHVYRYEGIQTRAMRQLYTELNQHQAKKECMSQVSPPTLIRKP